METKSRLTFYSQLIKKGDIVDIKAKSVHPLLEKEAIRIVNELPKMVPFERNGKRISQTFALQWYL